MILNELKVNSEFIYYDRKYIVISINPPNVVIKRVDGDGETTEMDFIKLISDINFKPGINIIKKIKRDNNKLISNYDMLDDGKKEKVTKIYNMIRPILILEKVKDGDLRAYYEFAQEYMVYIKELSIENKDVYKLKKEKLYEVISNKHGISTRQLKRYVSNYHKAENTNITFARDGLIPHSGTGYMYRKDNKQLVLNHPKKKDLVLDVINVRISDDYIPILKKVIEEEYLVSLKKRPSAICKSVRALCANAGIPEVNEGTIRSILKRINVKTMEIMRNGIKGVEKFELVKLGHVDKVQYPLQVVAIDHTRLDIQATDKNSGFVIGRPWITVGIDLFSRMIWCLHVSFEPPSINKVRKALLHGIFFKNTKEKYNTNNNWPVYGIPTTIQLDNGSDFTSADVKAMINEVLCSNVMYRPRGVPKYGGVIERFFGTLNTEIIHGLDGTTKSNIFEKGDYNSEEEAIYTLEDIRRILTIYITDIYHYEEHKGLPYDSPTPIVRYLDGIKKIGYPKSIHPTKKDIIKIELYPSVTRTCTPSGIQFENVIYNDEKLSELVSPKSKKYKIKFDPDDISSVYILNENTKEYMTIPAIKPSYDSLKGINLYTYKRVLKELRKIGSLKKNSIPGTKLVAKGLLRLRNEGIKAYKKSKKVRQELKRSGFDIIIPSNDVKTETMSKSSKSIDYSRLSQEELAAILDNEKKG